jgi:AAA+ superfamily predicted ATPase
MSTGGDDTIAALRAALKHSPNNIPLREHLAATLSTYGRLDEAEREFRDAIAIAPNQNSLKLGLARVYFQQSKLSQATVILEAMAKSSSVSPAARLLYARVLLKSGDAERAGYQYRTAIDADSSLADPALAAELGERETHPVAPDFNSGERIPQRAQPDPATPRIEVERPKVNFQNVGGMDGVKDEIRLKIIYPLQKPDLYKAYGKSIGGGILLYGPPGCGKTHLARATAGEVNAKFLAVGISDVLNMWLGESERNLHETFEQARASTPCVLFFDEVDALGASRTDLRHSAGRQLVNQFLSELDGVSSSNEGVLILAATNAPWHMDSAFRRPGRFDRIVFVPPPDLVAREAILKIMLAGKPTDMIDHAAIAKKTDGFSGADLKALVDLAIESKLSAALASGKPEPITTKDLLGAVKAVKPTAREWFSAAKNHALYANQAGVYDPVLDYLKGR